MRLIILGPPGAGKGTQTEFLAARYGIRHISTGDMLREHMRLETDIGNKIVGLMNSGSLVPDDIVIGLVDETLAGMKPSEGFIFDGFPRNIAQAEKLDELLLHQPNEGRLHKVIYVTAPDEVIIQRMAGRVCCPECGAVYHTTSRPPEREGFCSKCNSALTQREDDKEETVRNRLRIYRELTEPVIRHYAEKGELIEISGIGNIELISETLVRMLGE